MINGETPLPVLWWLLGPVVADWWIYLSVVSAVGVLAVLGVVHLAVGRIVPAPIASAVVEVDPEAEDDADPEKTVEIPPRGRRRPIKLGTICAPGVKVPPDPTVAIDPRAVRDAR